MIRWRAFGRRHLFQSPEKMVIDALFQFQTELAFAKIFVPYKPLHTPSYVLVSHVHYLRQLINCTNILLD